MHQLVTHTTGLGYWFWNEDLVRFEAATGTPNVVPGSMDAFKAPLTTDPGTAFVYGINTDWLGRVVEAVAGATLDVVVKEHVTEPLGMHDTMFRLDAGRTENLVTVHVPGDGGWTSAGEILNQEPDWWAGGHGLYSTPRDYIRFERALLRGGELDGTRILRRRRSMTPSAARSVTSRSPRRSRPPIRPPPTPSTSDRAGPGATDS